MGKSGKSVLSMTKKNSWYFSCGLTNPVKSSVELYSVILNSAFLGSFKKGHSTAIL